MSALVSWRLVEHEIDELPSLILRSDTHKNGYTIYLSDLEHVWTEQLKKGAVVERAHELGCSIDPGEDTEQYQIFTKKLRGALQQEKDTTLQFNGLRSGTNITLLLTAPLPNPLPRFEWEVHLQRRDDGLVRSELTTPLLDRTYALQQQILHLVSELQAKDHVLFRLTDRLEASGTPLSEVFPNVAHAVGRRPPSRDKLAQQVRGLAPFDEKAWSSQVSNGESSGIEQTLQQVLPQLTLKAVSDKIHRATWWRGLEVKIAAATTAREAASSQIEHDTLRDLPAPPDDSSTDDDEFQLDSNSTPSKARTTIEQADPVNSRTTVSPSPRPKKLGTIGGKSAAMKEGQESLPRPPDTPVKPKSKLGAIGGKKSVSVEPVPSQNGETSRASLPGRMRKLGAIGGRKADSTMSSQQAASERSELPGVAQTGMPEPAAVPSSKTEEPEIAEEDKADYRRDQLKRQQEQMKPAAKKKRKF